jgi:hypothetical protein
MSFGSQEPLRLTKSDLYSPGVDAFLDEQALMNRALPEVEPPPFIVRVFYSSYFYLSLAGGLGACIGWMILEPFFNDNTEGLEIGDVLMFPAVTGFTGLFLGAAEGIMSRNLQRAVICAAVGLGIGFAGGFGAWILAEIIFKISLVMMVILSPSVRDGQRPTGIAFLVMMMGRGTAWAVAAIPAGIGQGIALRENKVLLNGLLGGVLGGLLGGLLFDPISVFFTTADGQAVVSRAIGFTVIGLMVGLLVGIVEQWTKSAWLLMRAGPLAGKQFVVFRNPTVLGSAPKADIYLFKDEAIEPRHALIHDRGGRFEIEDLDTADGTYVNGVPVRRQILKTGDQIVLGKTVLEFALRESK